MTTRDKLNTILAITGLIIIGIGVIFAFRGSIGTFRLPESRWSGIYPPGIYAPEHPDWDAAFLIWGLMIQFVGALFILIPLKAGAPYFLWKFMIVAGSLSILSFSGFYFRLFKAIVYNDNPGIMALTVTVFLVPALICLTTGARMRRHQGQDPNTTIHART